MSRVIEQFDFDQKEWEEFERELKYKEGLAILAAQQMILTD